MIFLEAGTETAGTITIGTICTIAGGAVVWLVSQYATWKKENRKEKREDETEAISRYDKLLARVDKDREELKKQLEDERKDCSHRLAEMERQLVEVRAGQTRQALRSERAIAWIKHLEQSLRYNKIQFAEWTDTDADHVETAETEREAQP